MSDRDNASESGAEQRASLALPSSATLTCAISGSDEVFEPAAKKSHTVYMVEVRDPTGARWTVRRRFSEFVALHSRLQGFRTFSAKLPGKTRLGRPSAAQVAERERKLEAYLAAICAQPELFSCIPLLIFLGIISSEGDELVARQLATFLDARGENVQLSIPALKRCLVDLPKILVRMDVDGDGLVSTHEFCLGLATWLRNVQAGPVPVASVGGQQPVYSSPAKQERDRAQLTAEDQIKALKEELKQAKADRLEVVEELVRLRMEASDAEANRGDSGLADDPLAAGLDSCKNALAALETCKARLSAGIGALHKRARKKERVPVHSLPTVLAMRALAERCQPMVKGATKSIQGALVLLEKSYTEETARVQAISTACMKAARQGLFAYLNNMQGDSAARSAAGAGCQRLYAALEDEHATFAFSSLISESHVKGRIMGAMHRIGRGHDEDSIERKFCDHIIQAMAAARGS